MNVVLKSHYMLETAKTEGTENGKNPEDGTMRNQQVTTVDIAWLAGIIDGEGNLDLNRRYGKPQKGKGDARWGIPRIHIGSTEALMIEKISKIYDMIGISFWYHIMGRQKKEHKPCLILMTMGLKNVGKVLDLVFPYLTTKKDQAEVIMDYVLWRNKAMSSGNKDEWSWGNEHLDEYIEEVSRLKQDVPDVYKLSRKPSTPIDVGTPETIREDFPWIGRKYDIVRPPSEN